MNLEAALSMRSWGKIYNNPPAANLDSYDNWDMIVTVRKSGVLSLAILTVTANHTKRSPQQVPGMTCERSAPISTWYPLLTEEGRPKACS